MCEDVGNVRRMEDAGAAAVVLHSLFEEQIDHRERRTRPLHHRSGRQLSAEATQPLPRPAVHRVMGPEAYLEHIAKCKQAVKIPIIASLNGTTRGGWLSYAKQMEQAGADALELNIYYIPVDPDVTGEQVEQQYVDLVSAVKSEVQIPVAVKLGPYFSSMANMARKLDAAGRRRPGALQPLLPAGLRSGIAGSGAQPDPQQLARTAAAPALDRGALRQREGRPGPHRRRPQRHGRGQGHDGRAPRSP